MRLYQLLSETYHKRGLKRFAVVRLAVRLLRAVWYQLLLLQGWFLRLRHGIFTRGQQFINAVVDSRLLLRLFVKLSRAEPLRQSGFAKPVERLVVMVVVSDISVDPRVQKAVQVAVSRGFRVKVVVPCRVGTREPPNPIPNWGDGVSFEFPQTTGHALINHLVPWLFDRNVYRLLSDLPGSIVHAHDLNTAFMATAAGRQIGWPVVCDFHEWFSENVEWSVRQNAYVRNGWLKRMVMRRAEVLCMRHADAVVTVCDSIAQELQAMQPRADGVHVVRNIPAFDQGVPTTSVPLRQACGVGEGVFLLLWQGGIGPSRLLEPVIEALTHLPEVVFAIRGPGLEEGAPYRQHYERVAAQAGVSAQLRLLPPVPSAQVVAAAHGADAGIWTLPNLSKNFYFALPNKVFEYLASGLPVVGANFPEVQRLVDKYEVGFTFDPYDPKSIAQAVAKLRDDPATRARCAANTRVALADMDADAEWDKLGDLYETLFQQRQVAA